MQYDCVGAFMYGLGIFFIKLSILLQYLQIFAPLKSRNMIYWASHALIWMNLVFYFVCGILEIFACKAISKSTDPFTKKGKKDYINPFVLGAAASSINVLSDFSILILPQISIWKLQLAVKKKLQISAVFLLGVLSV